MNKYDNRHDRCDHEVADCFIAEQEVDYANTDLSELGHSEFKQFLAKNYKNYDPAMYHRHVEWLGDHEGYGDISRIDSVSGVPVTIDLRSGEYWQQIQFEECFFCGDTVNGDDGAMVDDVNVMCSECDRTGKWKEASA